jgi:hypothetical protein
MTIRPGLKLQKKKKTAWRSKKCLVNFYSYFIFEYVMKNDVYRLFSIHAYIMYTSVVWSQDSDNHTSPAVRIVEQYV